MNSNYIKFNNWAYQYYLDRNSANTIGTLAIEGTEIEQFCSENKCDLKFREIINQDWSRLLQQGNYILPRYFGLIALQCYAASKMQNDGIANEADYQTRFIEVSGISNIQELQNKFKEDFLNFPVQEQIWISIQKYFKTKNIEIIIPSQKTGRDRYVQYPKKQVVLNQEDLKEYIPFFYKIEQIFDEISFEEFQRFYKNKAGSLNLNRTNNIAQRNENEHKIKLKQIFDYFCSENWRNESVPNLPRNGHAVKNRFILLYDRSSNKMISLYNENNEEFKLTTSIFKNCSTQGFLFFRKSDEYENEYDLVNFLELEREYIIVSNNLANLNDVYKISVSFESIQFNDPTLNFFIGNIRADNIPGNFHNLINQSYPIEVNGIKIARNKTYLHTHPPKIIKRREVNFSVYHENKRLMEYKPENASVGKYQIRVPGFSNLNFEIIENPKLKQLIVPKTIGLKIQDLSLVNNTFDVQGLEYFGKFENSNHFEININNWIKAQTRENKSKTSNIILKAIIQSKNGN